MTRSRSLGPAVFGGGRIVAHAIEFGTWILVARNLDLDAAGLLALALLVGRYASFLGDWGAQYTGSREVARYGADSGIVRGLVATRLRVTAVVSAVLVAGFALVGWLELLPILGFVLFRSLTLDWVAHGRERTVHAVLPGLIQSLVTGVGVAAGTIAADAASVPSVSFIAWCYGLGGLLGLAASVVLNRDRGDRTSSAVADRAVAGWWAMIGIAALVYSTADSLLLGVFRSEADVAIYVSLYRLPNAYVMLLGLGVTALVPVAARSLAEGRATVLALWRRALVAGMAGGAVLLCSAVAAPSVLVAVFGERFEGGATALIILMLATAVVAVGVPFQVLTIAAGSDRTSAFVVAGSAVLNVALNLVAIPRWGMTGAAVTTLLTQSIPSVYYVIGSWRVAVQSDAAADWSGEPSSERELEESSVALGSERDDVEAERSEPVARG